MKLLYIIIIGFMILFTSCKEDSLVAEKHEVTVTGVVFTPNSVPSTYIAVYDNTSRQYENIPYSKDVFKLSFNDISNDIGATFVLIYCDGHYYSL